MIIGLLLLFLLLSVVRSYYLNVLNAEISSNAEKTKEETRPALLQFVKIVDSTCKDCFDINQIANLFQSLNVNITKSENLEYSSTQAKQLISKLGIKKIPALVISGEIDKPSIASAWSQLNVNRNDGSYYIESFPPYRNLTSGNIEGLVSLVTITDNSCSSCYNPATHKSILSRFGITPVKESIYDRNSTEGSQLITKYNITKVPTILLSPEANIYTSFVQIWRSVGTTEADGWFIFRATEQMGSYMDLTTGEVVSSQ